MFECLSVKVLECLNVKMLECLNVRVFEEWEINKILL